MSLYNSVVIQDSTVKNLFEKLHQKIEQFEIVKENIHFQKSTIHKEAIKAIRRKDKAVALRYLKREKLLGNRLQSLNAQILVLEEQIDTIESTQLAKDFYQTASDAVKTIQQEQAKVSVDKIEDLMDQHEEQKMINNEQHSLFLSKLNETKNEVLKEYNDLLLDDSSINKKEVGVSSFPSAVKNTSTVSEQYCLENELA